MTKQETKILDRARAGGRGYLLRTMAILHRAGSTRTQREIERAIIDACAQDEFTRVNGALVTVDGQAVQHFLAPGGLRAGHLVVRGGVPFGHAV